MNSRIATAGKAAALMAAFLCIALLTFSCDSNIKDDLADDGTTDDGTTDDGTAGSVPTAPGTLTVIPGSGQITVSWSAVSGAVSYDVYSHTGTDSALATVFENTTSTTSTVTGLTNGTAYYVWVKAKNSVGSSGFSPQGTGSPAGGAGMSFTEQNLVSSASAMVGSSNSDTYNAGIGQQITLAKAYKPTSFSVFVHSTKFFKYYTTSTPTGTATAVDLTLAIWNQTSSSSVATATAHINARTVSGEEEVIFTISGAPTIPSGNNILYAVYLPGSLASDKRGELLCYQSGTSPYANGVYWKSDTANDTTISDYGSKWFVSATSTWDLKFKLVGTEQ